MIEAVPQAPSPKPQALFCNVCSHEWTEARTSAASASVRLTIWCVASTLRRDEIAMLAEIGALNSLGHDRRSAMWQVERAIRPAGEMFERQLETRKPMASRSQASPARRNEYF